MLYRLSYFRLFSVVFARGCAVVLGASFFFKAERITSLARRELSPFTSEMDYVTIVP